MTLTPITTVECPDCDDGVVEHSEDRWSHRSGHYLTGSTGTCGTCHGEGHYAPTCQVCSDRPAAYRDESWTDEPSPFICAECVAEISASEAA